MMRSKTLVSIVILVFLAVALEAFIFGRTSAALDRPIKVGYIDCFSGTAALVGKDGLKGFELAIDKYNKEGVLGTTIKLSTRDDKFDPSVALSMAKELVMREAPDIMVVGQHSGVAQAVSNYCKSERIPLLVFNGKSEKITGENGHRYVFLMCANTYMIGKAAALGNVDTPFTKFWIAGDDYEYGHALGNAFRRSLKEVKPDAKVIGETWWKVGEPDLAPYMSALLSKNPEVVYGCGGGAMLTNIIKTCNTTGLNKKIRVVLHTAMEYSNIRPLGRSAPTGVWSTEEYLFYHPDIESNRKFVKSYKDAYGIYPGMPSYNGYVTATAICEAYKKTDTVDKEKFIDALEGMTIDSPTGKLKIRAFDHQMIAPLFWGVSTYVPEYDFVVGTKLSKLAGEDLIPTIDEVKKARGAK